MSRGGRCHRPAGGFGRFERFLDVLLRVRGTARHYRKIPTLVGICQRRLECARPWQSVIRPSNGRASVVLTRSRINGRAVDSAFRLLLAAPRARRTWPLGNLVRRQVARRALAGSGGSASRDDTPRDTSPAFQEELLVLAPPVVVRVCERCGAAIAADARKEALYCLKLCRQAASRARLRDASGRFGMQAPERCACCAGLMPAGLRPEALYCSKRCRQAASRARLHPAADPG
jgi:hypothetical protein